MKRLFWSIIVFAVCVVSLGFFRGWFSLSSNRETESHRIDVQLSVDTDKVKQDAEVVTGSSNKEDPKNE